MIKTRMIKCPSWLQQEWIINQDLIQDMSNSLKQALSHYTFLPSSVIWWLIKFSLKNVNTKWDLNGKVKMLPLSKYDSNIWFWIENISRNSLVFFFFSFQKCKIGTNYNTGTDIQSTKFWLRQYLEVIVIHWNIYFLKWSTRKQIYYKSMVLQKIKKIKTQRNENCHGVFCLVYFVTTS